MLLPRRAVELVTYENYDVVRKSAGEVQRPSPGETQSTKRIESTTRSSSARSSGVARGVQKLCNRSHEEVSVQQGRRIERV
jgi:hypothetical protein